MASATDLSPIADDTAIVLPSGRITIYWRGWLNRLLGVVNRLNANLQTGRGDPNTVVYGYVWDLYTDQTGGAGTTLYVKESGDGTTGGWVAK
jgi:hypothetical protein